MAPELSPRARQILDEVERDVLARRAALRPGAAPPPAVPETPDLHAELLVLADELIAQAERAWRWLERLDAALALPPPEPGAPGRRPGPAPVALPERARLAAVELAVAGLSRAEVGGRLVSEHAVADPAPLLDAVFGPHSPPGARMA
ncbi:MAG: hypothetical protein QOG11_226 [Solirubrobacteraceae bacterium]|nr:hypothetical protein [Solirubrobacteraceae bacterium]